MGKKSLTFGDTENEKNKFSCNKFNSYLARFLLVKKTINTLLVTCIMIIKLSHYV